VPRLVAASWATPLAKKLYGRPKKTSPFSDIQTGAEVTRVPSREPVSADVLKANLRDVYSYFRRLGVDSAAAEDLTQDTFLVTWQNRHKVSSNGKLRSYLYGVAYRRYLQHMDRARGGRTVAITDQIAAGPAADPGSDESQAARALREAVLSLPPNYRNPLVLLYWQDLSYQEAAHALSLRMGTFAWRVQQALKLLRQRLAESREEVADNATSTAG